MKLQIKWVKVVKKTNRFQIKSDISHYKFWIQPRCFFSSSSSSILLLILLYTQKEKLRTMFEAEIPIYIYIYIYRDWTQVGVKGPGPGPNFFFFSFIYFIFVVGPFKTLSPIFSISLASFTQITTIQSKNLTKTIKTFTMLIIFQPKKIYIYIYIFYHQRTKKSCVIGEVKDKCFTIIVNQYKDQLTLASC